MPHRSAKVLGFAAFALTASCSTWDDLGPTPPEGPAEAPRTTAKPSAEAAASPSASASGGPIVPVPPVPWARESIHPVRWTVPTDTTGLNESVRIDESRDGGATWTTVGYAPMEERYFRYKVPSEGPPVTRVSIVFRTFDGRGNEIVVRRDQGPDVTLTPSKRKSYTWTRVAENAPFGPRDGAGGVVHAGKMWLIGGWNSNRFPLSTGNDVWSSADGASWTLEKPNTFVSPSTFDHANDWEGRHFAGYHTFGGRMWIVGGDPIQGYYQTDVWSSADGKAWTRTDAYQPKLPYTSVDTDPLSATFGQTLYDDTVRPREETSFGKRTLALTGVFQGALFVMGGQRIEQFVNASVGGAAKAFDDVWRSTDGASFAQVPTAGAIFSPRALVSEVVEHGGRMWVVGGGLYDDPTAGRPSRSYFNDVWTSPDGAAWEKVPSEAPFAPRIWHNVKELDDRVWVLCGYDGGELGQGRIADNLGDAWYTSNGTDWYDAPPPPDFVPRHAATTWVHGGSLYVGAGNAMRAELDGSSTWIADVWKVTPTP